MSYSLQSTTSLSSLGDAIRSKTGGSSQMTVEEMITAVNSIVAGSSSSGWIKRKEFYETTQSSSATEIIYNSYLDIDTELEERKEWIFVFTTCKRNYNNAHYTHRPCYVYFLYCDGSTVWSYGNSAGIQDISTESGNTSPFNSASDGSYMIKFETYIDNTTHTRIIRINNNTTGGVAPNYWDEDLNLGEGGYHVSNSSKYVWGNLFYLDESFDDIPTINVPQLYNWDANGQSDNIIDAIFDRLTFNLSGDNGSNLTNAFTGSQLGLTTDWRSKEIYQLNRSNGALYNFGNMFSYNQVIKYPPKFVFTNESSQCNFIYQFYQTFYSSDVVKISSDTFPQDAAMNHNANTSMMFYYAQRLREVPQDFLGYAVYNATGTPYQSARAVTTAMYGSCKVLKEIKGAPFYPCSASVGNKDYYGDFATNCYTLHNLTFYKPNGSVGTMNAYNQTIDLSTTGYWTMGVADDPSASINVYLEPEDKTNKIIISASTNNATGANVEDLNSFGINLAYATYNRKSAVATINSLPDTSAAISSSGGTNTIKFKSGAGSAYGNDYDMSQLSAAEIAVATAKGWTVTLV